MTHSIPNPADEIDQPVPDDLVPEAADPDAPLRVPHEGPEDWETKFVTDPEAAEEATRERINEQFEHDKAEHGHADTTPTD